jgi:hypothetical protein
VCSSHDSKQLDIEKRDSTAVLRERLTLIAAALDAQN